MQKLSKTFCHLMTADFKGNILFVLPCLFSKVLSQLGLREASQIAHVLYSQSFCNGGTQLSAQVTAAWVKISNTVEFSVLLVSFYIYTSMSECECNL